MWTILRDRSGCVLALSFVVFAALDPARADEAGPSLEVIRAAVEKSLPLLEKGADGSMKQRGQCFTCHNQGIPLLALATARERGFGYDANHFERQIRFTARFLEKNRQGYLEGRGQGGQVTTAGYALWTLENGGWKPDETTSAVGSYLLAFQKDKDHWQSTARRPPSEQSPFTTTYVALRGLAAFGAPDQQDAIRQRTEQVRTWLLKASPEDTEDRVFRLWGLNAAGATDEEIQRAAEDLRTQQRSDGGWSQLDSLESDAYATGSALVALHQAGSTPTDDPAWRKGLMFLIRFHAGGRLLARRLAQQALSGVLRVRLPARQRSVHLDLGGSLGDHGAGIGLAKGPGDGTGGRRDPDSLTLPGKAAAAIPGDHSFAARLA